MNGLEKLSLLKMDFLGLTTLTIIADALKLIERHRGVKLTVEEIPMDDPHTYTQIFSKALTSGVFQFESPGMRDVLRRYQPDRVEDLIALNALYRPGPMDMIDDFVDRKHGRKEVVYDVPELKEILEETYGVMVYQEQVMQISNRIAGYSLGDADLLRRAMGKKKVEEMAKHRELLRRRCEEERPSREKGRKDFRPDGEVRRLRLQQVALGRLRVPGVRHRRISRRTIRIEFMSALLTSETGNTAKVVKYINECREMRIRVLAARRQFLRSRLHARRLRTRRRHPLRPRRDQERGRERRRIHRESAHRGRPLHLALRFLRARRSGRRQPPHDRELHQGRRDGYARRHPRAADGRDR